MEPTPKFIVAVAFPTVNHELLVLEVVILANPEALVAATSNFPDGLVDPTPTFPSLSMAIPVLVIPTEKSFEVPKYILDPEDSCLKNIPALGLLELLFSVRQKTPGVKVLAKYWVVINSPDLSTAWVKSGLLADSSGSYISITAEGALVLIPTLVPSL